MNVELFLARKISFSDENKRKISKPVITISILAIIIGIATMIVSLSIMTGYKSTIREKVSGFASHIQIIDNRYNRSYEQNPVDKNQEFYRDKDKLKGVTDIHVFATKSGIIKTKDNFHGVVLKGVSTDYNWNFFKKNLVEGRLPNITDSAKTEEVIVSSQLAKMLHLKTNDRFVTYFIKSNSRHSSARRFKIVGLYQSDYEEFDKLFVVCDIKHVQKLNKWKSHQVGGFEIYVDDFEKIWDYSSMFNRNYVYKIHEDGSKLRVRTVMEKHPNVFQWIDMIDQNVWIIITLMLIVAGFNMTSGLLVTILERTNMIGILKSIGYPNWSLRKVFLYQSAYIAIKGLIWGNIIGISFCLAQQYLKILPLNPEVYLMSYVPVKLNLFHVLLLNLGTLIITVIMLIGPSYLISKISPAKTIKFE